MRGRVGSAAGTRFAPTCHTRGLTRIGTKSSCSGSQQDGPVFGSVSSGARLPAPRSRSSSGLMCWMLRCEAGTSSTSPGRVKEGPLHGTNPPGRPASPSTPALRSDIAPELASIILTRPRPAPAAPPSVPILSDPGDLSSLFRACGRDWPWSPTPVWPRDPSRTGRGRHQSPPATTAPALGPRPVESRGPHRRAMLAALASAAVAAGLRRYP